MYTQGYPASSYHPYDQNPSRPERRNRNTPAEQIKEIRRILRNMETRINLLLVIQCGMLCLIVLLLIIVLLGGAS